MKTIAINAIRGISGKNNFFYMSSRENMFGKLSGITVNFIQYGNDKDLTRASLVSVLKDIRAKRVADLPITTDLAYLTDVIRTGDKYIAAIEKGISVTLDLSSNRQLSI